MTFAAEEGLGSSAEMIESMAPVEQMSRDLRPVLRSMGQGLTLFVEGRDVMREWTRLVDSSPVGCDQGQPEMPMEITPLPPADRPVASPAAGVQQARIQVRQ